LASQKGTNNNTTLLDASKKKKLKQAAWMKTIAAAFATKHVNTSLQEIRSQQRNN